MLASYVQVKQCEDGLLLPQVACFISLFVGKASPFLGLPFGTEKG